MTKRISVTSETNTGRNVSFHDNYKKTDMNRKEFVQAIHSGLYPKYMVKIIHGVPTPVSKPDNTKNNNLG